MTPEPTSVPSSAEPVVLRCADGVTLRGHYLPGAGGPALPVLIAPATGVPQRFYLRFARWLAAQGPAVLVFDYRGIGESLHGRLRDCPARLRDWGQRDQPAALEALCERTGADQIRLLGHSAGGQMLGLLPGHARVARLVGVAASTGGFQGMRPPFRWLARAVLRGAVPLGIRWRGYAPTAVFGLGENLPAGVALDWGDWCAAGDYARQAVLGHPDQDFHAAVRTPITVLHASDDAIATPATVADLLRLYPAAHAEAIRVRPADHGLRHIGHIDWFRDSHRSLWPLMARALDGAMPAASDSMAP